MVGQPETGVVVVCEVAVETSEALTGTIAEAVELVISGHTAEPHAWPVGQQPPPRLAGQEWKPVLQTVRGPWTEVKVGVVMGTATGFVVVTVSVSVEIGVEDI